jgi:threonine/homoserine/homoserine lactone efflux protein
MEFVHPVSLAVVTGFISGLLLSIPVGPINLTIINEGARRGFKWGALIGLGATVMEVVYCALAFTGFASFFQKGLVKAAMELFSFAFMLILGLRFLTVRQVPHATRIEEKVEEKIHPHSAFWIGFVRVMANPGVFVFWIILAANFISREWVSPDWTGKLSCVLGVALGCLLWFTSLSFAVSWGRRRFSEKTLVRMERVSGVCLLALALAHGLNIVWQMHKNKNPPGSARADQALVWRVPDESTPDAPNPLIGRLGWHHPHGRGKCI